MTTDIVPLQTLSKCPLVSVIIPSYNQGDFINETIESILSQQYRPLELIIIDGGSTDETVSILKSYNELPEVTWISEPDQGVVVTSGDDLDIPGFVQG